MGTFWTFYNTPVKSLSLSSYWNHDEVAVQKIFIYFLGGERILHVTLAITMLLLHLIFHLIAMSACWTDLSATFKKYNYYMKKNYLHGEEMMKRKRKLMSTKRMVSTVSCESSIINVLSLWGHKKSKREKSLFHSSSSSLPGQKITWEHYFIVCGSG